MNLNNNFVTALLGMAVLVGPAAAAENHVMELSVGQSQSLKLSGNPTTGFVWRVVEVPEFVQVEIKLEEREFPRDMVGCPCASVVTVTAEKEGRGVVKLVYARPWEKDTPPANTCHLDVTVK